MDKTHEEEHNSIVQQLPMVAKEEPSAIIVLFDDTGVFVILLH